MNGKENVRRKCGENARKIHLPATTFHTYFGAPFWVLSACSGFVREEIRDCTQLLPNKTGLSSTTTMAYSQYYYPVAVTLSVSICGKI